MKANELEFHSLLGTVTTSMGEHFINLNVINKSGKTVALMPDDNNPSSGYVLKPGYSTSILKATQGNKPVIFRAKDSNSNVFLINGKTAIMLKPSPSKGSKPFSFEIKAKGQG